jgi:cysteine-rich repeat protein
VVFPCTATFNTPEQVTHVCIPCGDGNLNSGEQCDDGNNIDGDGCSADCQREPTLACGDGTLDPGEQCDDGNTVDGDGCRDNCTLEICGDGIKDPQEQCDDGNTVGGDGCSATCTIEPSIGGEGCTPNYWKQNDHFDSWPNPYAPGTLFESVFGRDVPGNPTLVAALNLAGGGLNALMRHTVAALLNAASPDVDFDLTPAEVIASFQSAFDSGDFETTKDLFVRLNQQGCPLS